MGLYQKLSAQVGGAQHKPEVSVIFNDNSMVA